MNYLCSTAKYPWRRFKRPGKHIHPFSFITYQFDTVKIKLKHRTYGTHWGVKNAHTMLLVNITGRRSEIRIGFTEIGCECVD